ncbi:hypothetical protein RG959_15355 [Domibacillus sp. 8LH]|uniref:hypothetical protein n=1 Tax=Domibacillus sp. 8LH TaxID=3073900 RepID=UPI0031791106
MMPTIQVIALSAMILFTLTNAFLGVYTLIRTGNKKVALFNFSAAILIAFLTVDKINTYF